MVGSQRWLPVGAARQQSWKGQNLAHVGLRLAQGIGVVRVEHEHVISKLVYLWPITLIG